MTPHYRRNLSRDRFCVFLSYTNREDEVKLVKPLVNQYARGLWDWAREQGIEIFYDDFALPSTNYDAPRLAAILAIAATTSDLFTAFVSPKYIGSRWCRYEWEHGPLSIERNTRKGLVHPIHWKPDYRNWREDYHEQSMFPGTVSPEIVVDDIDRRNVTDVTDAWRSPSRISQAAYKAIEDSISIIKAKYKYFPLDFRTEA